MKMEIKTTMMKARQIVVYTLMWVIAIGFVAATCSHEVKEMEPIIITEDLVMWDSDHFVIMPQEPDTLTFVIVQAIDDNTLELLCITDSTTHTMEVESAHTPEYYEGIMFKLIKPTQ